MLLFLKVELNFLTLFAPLPLHFCLRYYVIQYRRLLLSFRVNSIEISMFTFVCLPSIFDTFCFLKLHFGFSRAEELYQKWYYPSQSSRWIIVDRSFHFSWELVCLNLLVCIMLFRKVYFPINIIVWI